MKMYFYGGEGRHFPGGVNYLISNDHSIYAEVAVPEGASEDYGYLDMKGAILHELEKKGIALDIEWPYEEDLPEVADPDCEVFVDIDWWEVE